MTVISPADDRQWTAKIYDGVAAIDARSWDACGRSGNEGASCRPRDPFMRHAFLAALERSGALQPQRGWLPKPVAIHDRDGEIVACAPLYVKGHSQGEYVFDHGWADVYERAGGRYYPKLQICAPFTPVAGDRFLIREDRSDRQALEAALWRTARELVHRLHLSSLHVTFLPREAWARIGDDREAGALKRLHHQFHWFNRGYRDYQDFLDSLPSRKRKNLKRERSEALKGLTIRRLHGGEISESQWDAFYEFYRSTIERKWGVPYLPRSFFSLIAEAAPDSILLIFADQGDETIAAALNFIGSDALFGRYWGCRFFRRFLHFELCYHQAIDYALEHGLARVEAGAQGDHKFLRGYDAAETYSLHYFADSSLGEAVGAYLDMERDRVGEAIDVMSRRRPFV